MEQRSSTPMAARLGFKPGMRVWFHAMPPSIRTAIAPERAALEELDCATDGVQAVHLFASRRDHLERELGALHGLLASNGFCWVSWPDAAPGGDLNQDVVAGVAAAHGWAEGDRCALEGWAGVRLTPVASPTGATNQK